MSTSYTNTSNYGFLFFVIIIISGNSQIMGQIRPWMPETWPDDLVFTAKGTGRTTGHIAIITVHNPTNEDVILDFPPLYIPSSGQYQPYVIPFPKQVSVPSGQSVNVPVEGYCVDIHRPPVPDGGGMPPVSTWIGKDPDLFTNTGINPGKLIEYWGVGKPDEPGNPPEHSVIDFFPVDTSHHHPVVSNHIPVEMLSGDSIPSNLIIQQTVWWHTFSTGSDRTTKVIVNSDSTDDNPTVTEDLDNPANFDIITTENIDDKDSTEQTNIQQTYWGYSLHIPKDSAMLTAPLYFDAIDKIIRTTDSLKANGLIQTPFSGNPPKERESVIQQTFWSYTAALHDEDYVKEDFKIKLEEQYTEATGQSVSTAPAQVQEQLSKGADDFWNTFQLVGAEAKVLQQPPTASELPVLPGKREMDDAFGKSIGDIKAHQEPAGKQASETVGAEAFESGKTVAKSGQAPSKDLAGHEVVHIKQDGKSNQQSAKAREPAQNPIKIEGQNYSGLPEKNSSQPSGVVNPKIINPFEAPDKIFGSGSDSTQVPAPKENCLCQSLHFSLSVERYLKGDGNKVKEQGVVIKPQRITSQFPSADNSNQIDIDKVLDFELRENEYFVISFFDPEVKCVCQSEGSNGTPCISYDNSRQKNSTAKQGVGVDVNKASSANVKSANKVGAAKSMKFTIVPNNKSEVIVQFDFTAFCSSNGCAPNSKMETSCNESFVIKLSSPKK